MTSSRCCECKQAIGRESVLVCASCGGVFHYPDSRIGETGRTCGAHLIGLRQLTGRDATPMCLRCDMAFRLQHGIPAE